MTSTTPGCVGITLPAAASYPTRELAGHKLTDLPGGLFVMGLSPPPEDATSRWVYLDPYSIGQTAVSEHQYRTAVGFAGVQEAPKAHPVTMVSYKNALEYLEARGSSLRLPTEAERENAARGPAVNMQQVMEEETGRFTLADFADFAEGRFENFVFGILGQILRNPAENQLFRKLIERGMPFYGWRVYGTPSGRLNHDEAWYDQSGTTTVEWGPANAYGLKGMTGGVWEWVQDWYAEKVKTSDLWNPTGPDIGACRVLRGGSWFNDLPLGLRAAACYIYVHPGRRSVGHGFRVAAPGGFGG